MSEQLTNSVYNPTAQLSAGIEAADLSLTVSDVSEFIDTAGDPLVGEFRVLLWDGSTDASKELVKVGAFDSGTGVCSSLTRAVEGKNPAMDHAAGDLVELVISAGGLEQYVSDHSGGGTSVSVSGDDAAVCLQFATGPFDAHDPGTYPLAAVFAQDNDYAGNQILAVPSGLGLDLAIDGSNPYFTAREDGVWWIEAVTGSIDPDASWAGYCSLSNASLGFEWFSPAKFAQDNQVLWRQAVPLPSGAEVAMVLNVTEAATADPYTVSFLVSLIRLR